MSLLRRRPMGQDDQLKVRLDRIAKAKLAVAADRAGVSLSDYVGDLVERDVTRVGHADLLASQLLEVQITVAILLRALLARTVGDAEATALLNRAQAKARDQVRAATEPKPSKRI